MKKTFLVKIQSLLLVMLFVLGHMPVFANAQNARDLAKAGTVQVFTLMYNTNITDSLCSNGEDGLLTGMAYLNPVMTGSGFFVEETGKYVVTNASLVDEEYRLPEYRAALRTRGLNAIAEEDFKLFYLVYYKDAFYMADLLCLDPDGNDMAVLSLKTPPNNVTPLAFSKSDSLYDEHGCFLSGFVDPVDARETFQRETLLAFCISTLEMYFYESEGKAFTGKYTSKEHGLDSFSDVIFTDLTVTSNGLYSEEGPNYGSSGGPVVNSSGQIVGMMSIPQEGILTPTLIMKMLDTCHVKYNAVAAAEAVAPTPAPPRETISPTPRPLESATPTIAGENQPDGSRNSSAVIWILAVVLIAMITGICVLKFVIKPTPVPDPSPGPLPDPVPTPSPAPPPDGVVWTNTMGSGSFGTSETEKDDGYFSEPHDI